jgi:hypothetical protein
MSIIDRTFTTDKSTLPTIAEIKQEARLEPEFGDLIERSTNEQLFGWHEFRSEYVSHSFPILSHELITSMGGFLSKYKRCVELACGEGWLTHWLNTYYPCCVDECIDNFSWDKHDSHLDIVSRGIADRYVREHPNVDVFILSWPYMDSLAYLVWKGMNSGQELLFIGEDWGGCTADDDFFRSTTGCDVEHNIEGFVSFYGIHDTVRLFRKP